MSVMSPDTVLLRNERLAWRVLDGEAVILFPEEGTLHRLNGTGTRAWELLDGTRSLADIGDGLKAEFEVTHREALLDLQMLAADLVGAGLAEVRATP